MSPRPIQVTIGMRSSRSFKVLDNAIAFAVMRAFSEPIGTHGVIRMGNKTLCTLDRREGKKLMLHWTGGEENT